VFEIRVLQICKVKYLSFKPQLSYTSAEQNNSKRIDRSMR